MEKAKAYIKNELRGGSSMMIPQQATGDSAPGSEPHPNYIYHSSQQQNPYYYSNEVAKYNNNLINEQQKVQPHTDVIPACYVCGGPYGYEPIRVRPNPERPKEPFFPFLERHEAPTAVSQLSATQQYVMVCTLCYRLLGEQWEIFERDSRPYAQRIYHLKRIDGKPFIGADMATQGEYAAQLLGISTEHSVSGNNQQGGNNLQHSSYNRSSYSPYPSPQPVAIPQRPTSRDFYQQQRPSSHNSPMMQIESPHPSNLRNESPRAQPHDYQKNQQQNFNPRPSSRNTDQKNQSRPVSRENPQILPPHQSPSPKQPIKHQTPPLQQLNTTNSSYEGFKSSFAHQKFKLGQLSQNSLNSIQSLPQNERESYQDPKYSSSYYAPQNEDVLDLRNLHHSSSPQTHPPPMTLNPSSNSDVGILDLSMPDKNSTTEVCYVCGDEQRRGSLIEVSTVEPKDPKDKNRPYFPIFNETHPRPPRSRPKDPRGMIQACQLCYDHLMQQWSAYQSSQTSDAARSYTLRKVTTFVCYTCGVDTLSSQLRMVYCCQNAEGDPYYPFIKDLKPFPKASPITQGMVQICSSCNDKYSHKAEGGTQFNNVDGLNNVMMGSGGSRTQTPVATGGRYTPSEKSQANSDSASNVRFKPYETNNSNSSSSVRDLKTYRKGDSRPTTPVENGHGQYSCHTCKIIFPIHKMEWLSTSAEHMNSHVPHFPFLKSTNDSSGSNRVLACKDCVNHLTRQWDSMDAERVPLEHRRYNIPSPAMLSSTSPNGSSRHGGNDARSPPSTPSISSTPASTSIYCFLCNLHSDLQWARVLFSTKEGTRPYFPFLLKHKSPPNAEQLRGDYSALVCTFCYHSLLNQWRKYEAQSPNLSPADRKYNWHDYICHLCEVTTYRKRVRALPLNEFPSLARSIDSDNTSASNIQQFNSSRGRPRKSEDALLLENGEYAVVCLDCYESLRQQASQYDRFGVPISRREYNWVPQPPPPEDGPDVSVARLPCGERSDKIQLNTGLRPISNKKNTSPKQFSSASINEKTKDIAPPKAGQKRPATSPAPITAPQMNVSSNTSTQATGASSSANPLSISNHLLGGNHIVPPLGNPSMPGLSQPIPPPASGGSNSAAGRGPFASALRNLAKQADVKEDEESPQHSIRERSNISSNTVQGNSNGGQHQSQRSNNESRSDIRSSSVDERSASLVGSKKQQRTEAPTQPPEKIPRLSAPSALQPELLVRSGFQPYRSDDRHLHPAGAFPLDAYSPFAGLAIPPGGLFGPGIPYPEQLYLDSRFQSMFRASAHHPHSHLYSPMASPYASHLYSMLPGSAALGLGLPNIHERLKLEEEHRARLQQEEREREMREQREKEVREQREREQREKEQREKEQREREQREKEQREKEQRELELREKERENQRERERLLSAAAASHHYPPQLYSPLSRNILGSMGLPPPIGLGLRPPPQGAFPSLSPYHSSNQRQSPHHAVAAMMGLPLPPNLSAAHSALSSSHLPPTSLGMPHPNSMASAHSSNSSNNLSLSHPALGLAHHGLNLPHLSQHITSQAQHSTHNNLNVSHSVKPEIVLASMNSANTTLASSNVSAYYSQLAAVAASNQHHSQILTTSAPMSVPSSVPLNFAHSHYSNTSTTKTHTVASNGNRSSPSNSKTDQSNSLDLSGSSNNQNNGKIATAPIIVTNKELNGGLNTTQIISDSPESSKDGISTPITTNEERKNLESASLPPDSNSVEKKSRPSTPADSNIILDGPKEETSRSPNPNKDSVTNSNTNLIRSNDEEQMTTTSSSL